MKKVSIVIPCYNEEKSLPRLYDSLHQLFEEEKQYQWEVLLINDGSQDNTYAEMKRLRQKDSRFCLIDLSRNFGKENAMLAGFDNVSGDCMVIMDADLQDPPYVVKEMLLQWQQGYDDIYAKRISRGKESWMRRRLTLLYYYILRKIAKIDVLPNVGDFRLMDRRCIDALCSLRETQRYTKGLYTWIGFRKKEITFDRGDRESGQSSFNYLRLFNLAVEGITSYTTAPLRLSTVIGLITSLVAFIYMCYIFIKTLLHGDPVQGFPTLITVILFLGGIQLISIGIIGEYLGRIFHETKHRPAYFIREMELGQNPSQPEKELGQ